MDKHTPGPWTAHEPDEELDKYHWTIRAPGTREGMVSFEVARISGKNNDTDANTARLIAAAPDLLQALRHVLPHVGVGYSGAQRQGIVEVARTAIAKATGENK